MCKLPLECFLTFYLTHWTQHDHLVPVKDYTTSKVSENIFGFSPRYPTMYDSHLFVLILIKDMHPIFLNSLLGPGNLDITNIINIKNFKGKSV